MFPKNQWENVAVAVGILTIALGFAYHVAHEPMDFRVYHYGARGVFDGSRPVYGETSGLGWPMHYRYPPLFLLLFAPFAALPLGYAAAIWLILKVFVLVWLLGKFIPLLSKEGWAPQSANSIERSSKKRPGVVSNVAKPPYEFQRSAPHSRTDKPPRLRRGKAGNGPTYAFIITSLFIAPYLIEEFRYGNAQFFVFALTAAALMTMRSRPRVAAASLALAISIKVWPLFFVPYLAVRRDWKVVAYTLGFVTVLALLPAIYFGVSVNFNLIGQWVAQESQTQLGESEIWFPNQSLRGMLMRYLTVIDYSQVPDSNYPQVNVAAIDPAAVRLIWIILAGAAYAAFLCVANRRRESDGWLDHGVAFCLLVLLEPFSQKYALAVLLWPAMIASTLVKNPRARILVYCATGLVLIQPLASGASAQRFLQVLGLDFFATLMLTAALGIPIIERGRVTRL